MTLLTGFTYRAEDGNTEMNGGGHPTSSLVAGVIGQRVVMMPAAFYAKLLAAQTRAA
jgi:hypothetical protein